MKHSKSALTLVVLLLALLSLSAAAVAPTLTFTYTDVNAPGAIQTDSYAINVNGVIAGDYVDSSSVQHGMILTPNGTLTSFDNSDCQTTGNTTGSIAAFGINKKQAVAGWCYSTSTGLEIGWVYAYKKFRTIAFPNAPQTEALGINDAGDVVGTFIDSAGAQHGFLLHSKKYTQIDVKGDTSTTAWAINNLGQITVYAVNSSGTAYDSFVLTGAKRMRVSDPNALGLGTVIHAINDNGDVDGTYYANSSNSATHGFLRHGGKYYTDVEDPNGSSLTRADGLNNSRTVVGRYSPSSGGNVGFKATSK